MEIKYHFLDTGKVITVWLGNIEVASCCRAINPWAFLLSRADILT